MSETPKPFDDVAAAAEAIQQAPPVTEGVATHADEAPQQPVPQVLETPADRKASKLFGRASERAFEELSGQEAPDLLKDACEAIASIALEFSTIAGKGLIGRTVLVTGALALVFTPAVLALVTDPKEKDTDNA